MKKILNYILFSITIIFIGLNGILAAGDCVSCGDEVLPIPLGIPKFVSNLITIAQIAVPVLIIVISMVNYIKAVGSGEDKVIKEVNMKFIRSLIAGVSIFLLVAIVKFVFNNLLGTTGNDTLSCISCFMDSDTCQTIACPGRPDMDSTSEENPTSNTYYCYVCPDDDTKRFWRTSNPGVTTVCPSGYQQTDYNKEKCNEHNYKCYKCNGELRFVWSAEGIGSSYDNYSCPQGWTVQENKKSEAFCKVSCYDYTTETDCNNVTELSCKWMDSFCGVDLMNIVDSEKICEDYTTKDSCPDEDDIGRACEWKDNSCKGPESVFDDIIESEKKKSCEDYTTKETCKQDEYGRECQWKNNACSGLIDWSF